MADESDEDENEKVEPEMRVLTVHLEPVLLPRLSGYSDRIMMDVTSCDRAKERAKNRTKEQQFEDDVAALMAKAKVEMKDPPRRGLRPEEQWENQAKPPVIYSRVCDTTVQEPGYYLQPPPNKESSESPWPEEREIKTNSQSKKLTKGPSKKSSSLKFKAVGLG